MSDSAPVIAICPGSYDPVTNGHVDIIRRAAQIFDRVVVGVVRDPQHKSLMFTVEERVRSSTDALAGLTNVEVEVFSELVVDFARQLGGGDDDQGTAGDLRLRVGVPDAPPEPHVSRRTSRRCT